MAIPGTAEEFDIEPTVEANGNKPISPLSVAAELPCFQKMNCFWGSDRQHPTA
jgi:hypothetical protein